MTFKGSKIRRSRFGVGKPIGGNVYLHKSYYTYLPKEAQAVYEATKDKVPFEFNCLRYNMKDNTIVFIECPDFDEAREPVVGRIFKIDEEGNGICSRPYQQVYHHKWAMVRNDYTGFNVERSWKWSVKWLNVLTVRADGSSLENWKYQLRDFGLE